MIDYKLGKIYKIVNDVNDIIYVGSSAQRKLSNRMRDHRSHAKDLSLTSNWNVAMRTIGISHFKIILVCSYPCSSKDELEAKEFEVINEFKSNGQEVYNSVIDGKHSDATKKKCIFNRHTYGSVMKTEGRYRYIYKRKDLGLIVKKSFSINKYGEAKAKELAEQAREQTKAQLINQDQNN